MLLNELFEVGANPAYLSAAERSLSQARDTQRQYWRSPEEKAAARRTELKREKGIAGYSKRHRAANPDMYPAAKSQPAPKLRDPSTEYSDDYSVWAAGHRDTMEQGVAEDQLNELSPKTLQSYEKKAVKSMNKNLSQWVKRGDWDALERGDRRATGIAKAGNKLDAIEKKGVAEDRTK